MHDQLKNQNQFRKISVLFRKGDRYNEIFERYHIIRDFFDNFQLRKDGFLLPWDCLALSGIVDVIKTNNFSFYCCMDPKNLAKIRLMPGDCTRFKITISTVSNLSIERVWVDVPEMEKQVGLDKIIFDGGLICWVGFDQGIYICNEMNRHFNG